MKRLTALLIAVAVVFSCGFAWGQQAGPAPPDALTPFGPIIGTWRYEGPLLESVPGTAEKGSKFVFQLSSRWILDKKVVLEDWSVEYEGGKKVSGKSLIGWNAADNTITYGGMDSDGGMGLGTIVFDAQAKTCTLTVESVDDEGQKLTGKNVVMKTGKDTITWQALERTGGDVDGPSPVYTLTRVPAAPSKKVTK